MKESVSETLRRKVLGVCGSTLAPACLRGCQGPSAAPQPSTAGGAETAAQCPELPGWREKAWEVRASETAFQGQAGLRLKTSGASRDITPSLPCVKRFREKLYLKLSEAL